MLLFCCGVLSHDLGWRSGNEPFDRAPPVSSPNLFQQAADPYGEHVPLAARMRPTTLDELVGQEHLVGPGTVLRRAIEADEMGSAILQGPPGCGKSTLAYIVGAQTRHHFEAFSAVLSGVAEIRRIAAEARERQVLHEQSTILFVDEIHRLSKAQQDAFLPHVENGTFVLIGATTENPYFTINSPLLSRTRVYVFQPLNEEDLVSLLQRALADTKRGLGGRDIEVEPEALTVLAGGAEGDARVALNALELAAQVAPEVEGARRVDADLAAQAVQERVLQYDRAGDAHYDTISAYIKSVRGSDPDAALYWLARMVKSGEEPRFIARRLMILAAEDIGLADPMALVMATAAAQSVDMIGWPEAQITLAEATIYLAVAPKSNSSYEAIKRAVEDVEQQAAVPVPDHLRSGPRAGDAERPRTPYLYPHDYPGAHVSQEYLPRRSGRWPYYRPKEQGREAKIAARLAALRRAAQEAEPPAENGGDDPGNRNDQD